MVVKGCMMWSGGGHANASIRHATAGDYSAQSARKGARCIATALTFLSKAAVKGTYPASGGAEKRCPVGSGDEAYQAGK